MADWDFLEVANLIFPGIGYDFQFHFGARGAKAKFDFKFTLGWLIGNSPTLTSDWRFSWKDNKDLR